jgi:hypothetical protein
LQDMFQEARAASRRVFREIPIHEEIQDTEKKTQNSLL